MHILWGFVVSEHISPHSLLGVGGWVFWGFLVLAVFPWDLGVNVTLNLWEF